MEETITQRIHVSGLTPNLTVNDLSQRLSSFGTVKAVDGFGLLDAVGQTRKFGYVTLETTKSKLARCMNLLSGVTWKGTKLRLGEAKPDFRERIAKEHESLKRAAEDPSSEQARKRRRLPRGAQGAHAADMSLVAPETAASRPGWRVTALGRLIRPIRMRPDHPLPEPLAKTLAENKKGAKTRPRRVKSKAPPIRARRRTIDPTNWGSQHIKGVFLENVTTGPLMAPSGVSLAERNPPELEESSSSEDEDETATEIDESDESEDVQELIEASYPLAVVPTSQRAAQVGPSVVESTPVLGDGTDLLQEKRQALGLLQSLFGDRENEDWGGREELDSDIDLGNEAVQSVLQDDAMDVDLVPQELSPTPELQPEEPTPTATEPVQKTKLKDLFAPREEEAGFSLLGHLDLDLELDDELDISLPPEPQTRLAAGAAIVASINNPSLSAFDPKRPLFFPLPPEQRDRGRARVRDALDTTDWRSWFSRTEPEEDIQKRWEETRGNLTRSWKTRHREAVKARRRRGGGADEAEA